MKRKIFLLGVWVLFAMTAIVTAKPPVNRAAEERPAPAEPTEQVDPKIQERQEAEDSAIKDIQTSGVGQRFKIPEIKPNKEGARGSCTIEEGPTPEIWALSMELPKDSIPLRGFSPSLPSSSGSILRFKGKILFKGIVFEGDRDDPLTFVLLDEHGFVYVQGKGQIKMKDGTLVSLPSQESKTEGKEE